MPCKSLTCQIPSSALPLDSSEGGQPIFLIVVIIQNVVIDSKLLCLTPGISLLKVSSISSEERAWLV